MSRESPQPIRPDVEKVLREAFPRGVMAPALDVQKSYLAEVFPRLKKRLLALDGAAVAYERDPLGGSGWDAGDGRLPSGPSAGEYEERPASYYLLFLAATAEPYQIDHGLTLKVGYSVALSVMAPMALVTLNFIEDDEDHFASSVPDIAAEEIEIGNGDSIAVGDFCRERLSPQGLADLERLRGEITATVEEHGFGVLPEEEQEKPIPWLEVPAMPFARPAHLTVRDALFFWAM